MATTDVPERAEATRTAEGTSGAESATAAGGPLDPGHIMQLGLGFWSSKVVLSAVELGVFTELARGPQEGEALGQALGLHPRGAADFLDALVALGMLARDGGHYANTPACDLFLDRNKPSYVGGMLEMANARLWTAWGHLTEALQTGAPQNEIRDGGDLFAALYADQPALGQFLHAMTGLSAGASMAIADRFAFERYETVADIGCAEGGTLVHLAHRHPHLRGIGFDLPPVRPLFERFIAESGVADQVEFAAGDFFVNPLPQADVLVFGHILHDWDLDEKRRLLAKAYDALPSGGAVIVFESIIDDARRDNAFGLLMSLNMLVETRGGFDYTAADCQQWLRDAGFTETYHEALAGPDSMVVGIK